MAQHDYILDNQSGANFRADLNNALAAVVSNNSGATQPSTMYAYEWWIDTSNNLLKLRNSGNSAWITLPISITADNTVDINGGTVNGISSFSFSSGSTVTTILDEDDFSSNSATALATQQSIKAYIDSEVTAQDLDITDGSSTIAIDLDSETLSLLGGTGVTAAASGNGVTFSIGQAVGTSSNVVFNQVTAALVGNASTATALATARTINGTSFDGTSNISFDTDSVSEGSSNLYFTNARARSAISESSTQLSYNSSTGVLTFTQGDTDTVSEGSSNLYHTTARVQAISINNVVEDTTPQLGGNLDINGQEIVSVSNGNIKLTPNGSGVVRIDGDSAVDIEQGSISIKNGGTQSKIDFYCESSNAHYARLQAPAHADFSGNVTITLPTTTGTLALTTSSITGNAATATALQTARTISGVSFDGTANITLDTDNISEGSSNLYYTNARFDTRFSSKDTDNLSEGSSNKYFTDERVDDRVSSLLVAGTGISLTYNDASNTLTIDGQVGDITSVVAGDGLTGGGSSGDVTLTVSVDDSSIEINSDSLRVKASGITNAMLAGSIVNSKLSNSSITINSNSVALGASVTLDTDDIGEGSTNLYHTSSRVNTLIDSRVTKTFVDSLNVVAASSGTADTLATPRAIALAGDVVGTANFDGSAGISITTAIQANSVALGTDTTGNYVSTIAGTSNEIEVSGSGSETASVTIGLPDDVTISNDLTVSGNLTVTGTTTQTGATLTDSNFQGLTEGNTGNSTDFGFYGKYVESTTTKFAGLFYDASTDNTFRLFCDTQTRPSTTVNTGATGYAKASLVADLVGNASTASTLETARTINGVSFNGSANISFDSDAVSEGSSNLYFTNERVSDQVGSMVSSNTETGITVTYDDADNTLDFVINAAQTTITSILATDLKIGEDDETKIDFETADEIHFYAGNQHQIKLTDGALIPVTTNDIDLGTSSLEFKDAFFDGVVTSDSFVGELTGNSSTATKLATTRSIGLGGDLGGSANFDGSAAITIAATIQADAVEQSMIADDAVGADQLAANAVVTGSIVDDNVTQAKIADDAVGADQLAASAVVTASVVDDAITQAKIADDAVGSAQIADNSVDIARLNVSDGSNGQVLTTDGAGNLSFATASGGASDLDGLSDAKAGGTNFSNSLILGHATTGTLSNAQKNTFVGFGAGDEITSTQNSCGFGFNCLTNLESGARSNGYGKGALDSVTTGDDNTGLGFEAGQNISTGGENVAVGNYAFRDGTGSSNTVIGFRAGRLMAAGGSNVIIGSDAGYDADGGGNNAVYIGFSAGYRHDAGNSVYIGKEAGVLSTSSDDSTLVGAEAGEAMTTGYTNTMLGDRAGKLVTTGYANTLLGYKAGDNLVDGAANIVLGSGDTSSSSVSNECTIIASTIRANTTSISSISDARDKSDIEDSPYGLDLVNKLKTRKWLWDSREGYILDGETRIGFVAQEIQDVITEEDNKILDLVYESNPDKLEVKQGQLIPVLLKAIQELSGKVADLEEQINE
tara:strand:+ start:2227 stop:6753 length:4527 start_codon:yes stop_codon:yes gene_type:complete